MARVRNNQGHRNKILNVFMRPYLEQELTQEKEAFDQAREIIKPLQDKTWQLAKEIAYQNTLDVMFANRCHDCGCTPKNDEWADRAKNLCIDCQNDEE